MKGWDEYMKDFEQVKQSIKENRNFISLIIYYFRNNSSNMILKPSFKNYVRISETLK